MNIVVELFASLRERIGQSQIALTLPDHASLADVAVRLTQQWPEAEPIVRTALWAINETYRPGHTTLRAGDRVAVIPPVAGG